MTEKATGIFCFVIFIMVVISICYVPRELVRYRRDVIEQLEAMNSKLDKLPYVPPMFRQGGNTGAVGETSNEQ